MKLFQIDDKCQAYNKLAMSIDLIPPSAENACGIDFRLSPSALPNSRAKFDANIKLALNQVLMKFKSKNRQSTESKLRAMVECELLGEQLSERKEALQEDESALKRMDEAYALKREQLQGEVQKVDADYGELQREIASLKSAQ